MTKDAIWSRLEDEFGTDIRATPGADGAGLWAWVIPILATLGAVALAVVLARRWVGRKRKEEPRSTEISPEQRRRLDVELAALRDQRG